MSQYCNRCQRTVKNPCIHDSQVKWCKQKAIMSASEIYGAYETDLNGVVVEKGIGPITIGEYPVFTEDFLFFQNNHCTTKVRISSISL